MAATTGTSADALKFLQELEESPYRHDFFITLRRLESMYPDKPRFGTAARPSEEPVRLGQEPTLAFAPSTLASFRAGGKDKPHRLQSFFFGLFGPNAPLPLHLTEYVRDRERQEDDRTFRSFADLFHHRLLLLFYRAWADARPPISMDRRTPRRCDTYVGSTFGLAAPEFRDRDAVPDDAKLHLAGRFALQTRPAEGLLAILVEFTQLPFRLKEFMGEWARRAEDDHLLLGAPGSASVLGRDTVIGQSVWGCQHKFRLYCGPLDLKDFSRLLPGRGSLERLRDLVRGYVGLSLEWDLNLILKHKDVPACRLGNAGELGWTSWLGDRTSMADADDVIIRPNAT